MDVLRPGHAHRSSSDRLLKNYMDSQKQLKDALLTLLSHAHPSTSSLLAYVTSSPGVVQPVRKAVRHSGFEGPLSGALLEAHGSQIGSNIGMEETQGWAAYMSSMDDFRKDLKTIHNLEEEMSRVRRDREILVTRLIKTTKSRPTKSDLSAMASSYSQANMSSRGSSISVTSDGSTATKEGKRAGKLAEAQAELLGCEEHLRSLEVKIEKERNKVMLRGLEERFRAMEAVGRMWVSQAKKGLGDLDKAHDLPANAFELDSNGSIAPSQSASQVGYDDHRRAFPKGFRGPGSISGSIAEENEEGSSDEEGGRNLTVHENRAGAATPRPSSAQAGRIGGDRGPTGVPSVTNYRSRMSNSYGGGNDSDSDAPGPRRRAASDVGRGGMAYTPITKRRSLRRAHSDDRQQGPALTRSRSNGSNNSSARGGVPVKKKGFFASIGRLFKGGNKRRGGDDSGRDSPPYGSGSKVGGWSTRTDTNLKRASSGFGGRLRGRGGDDSSSDEDNGNLVSVSNNRNSGFSVDNIGRGGPTNKRNSSTPIASGLIPSKPTRSDLGAGRRAPGSTSTITARNPTGTKATTNGTTKAAPGMSRSNTVRSTASVAKSTTSVGTARTTGTVKSATAGNTGSVKKTRQNGSISRATGIKSQPATSQNNMMSLVSGNDPKNPAVPMMPDIPKAPRSQVTPQMELPKAPGSSIVRPGDPPREIVDKDEVYPHHSISRSNSLQKVPTLKSTSGAGTTTNTDNRSTTPLPSRFQPAPLKSALRPLSPTPLAPPLEMPTTLLSITAPGRVDLPREDKPLPSSFPIAPSQADRPRPSTRTSYTSMNTEEGASVYESAIDGDSGREQQGDSSSEEEDSPAAKNYKYVDNERVKRLGINVGPPTVEKLQQAEQGDEYSEDESVGTEVGPAPVSANTFSPRSGGNGIEDDRASRISRASNRKSVRITAPDSPMDIKAPAPLTEGYPMKQGETRAESPEPAKRNGAGQDAAWSTRIGRMRDDTSDEEDGDEGYAKARKGLSKNSGQFKSDEQLAGEGKKGKGVKKSKSTTGSLKSKSSKR